MYCYAQLVVHSTFYYRSLHNYYEIVHKVNKKERSAKIITTNAKRIKMKNKKFKY